jgi:hypothetical protein
MLKVPNFGFRILDSNLAPNQNRIFRGETSNITRWGQVLEDFRKRGTRMKMFQILNFEFWILNFGFKVRAKSK